MEQLKIGIIVADVDEYKLLAADVEAGEYEKTTALGRDAHKYFIETEKGKAEIFSLLCGVGKVNAAAGAMYLIDRGCNVIINYGLSGGVSGIVRGEICLPDRFLEHDFNLTMIGYKPCEKPAQDIYIYEADATLLNLAEKVIKNTKRGTAVTGDSFICDDNVRVNLANQFNARCCDMETAAIAYSCYAMNVPFLAIRCVSDDAGNDAKDVYREMNTSDKTMLYDYVKDVIKYVF